MNSEDDKVLTDKNKKKTFKTPSQLEALEQFYDEHKYPSEFMKLQLAEKIGLTEKQVSSWFCHRRLKDKRLLNGEMYANGRQDRSSGVVQDSCGSTKQGQNKTQDPIEVQSNRFNSQLLSAAGLMLEHGSNRAGNYSIMDDTSSGSSSAPHNVYSKVGGVYREVSKSSAQNVVNYVNAGKSRSGPSGYLKVKGCLENPAVTAVKLQLGAHYRDDGPPLGIEFDPLPPGAFEPSNLQPENSLNSSETYSAEECVRGVSPVAQELNQECISKPYHIEEDNLLHLTGGSRVHKQRPSSEFPLSEKRPVDMHEDSPPDMAIYDRRHKYESRPKTSDGGSFFKGLLQ
ncbi:hypothetical protein LIER_08041 [Lithospermum erythrorhizon]|uniref:Homeobox domain-containing protein n=1 Tax=Lithospermum erythrorhizon TaxID=34254 RepID=A0AAV3PAK4_LITER